MKGREDQPRSGRPSTYWYYDKNLEKVRKAKQCRSLLDHWGDFWDNWFVLEFVSADVKGRFEYETCFPKIRSSVVDRGSKKQSFECLLQFKGTSWKWPRLFLKLWPEMRLVATVTTQKQNKHWANGKHTNSPKAKKAWQVRSNDIMFFSFFYADGIVHKEFVPPGQTVNQQFYLKVVKRLCDSIRKKRPEMWSSGDWFLHHDNATAHTALSVQQFFFLAKNMMVITHPPYSPNLAPCNFFLFPRMKGQMTGNHFADVSKVKKKTLEVLDNRCQWSEEEVLNNISMEEFQKCFQQWEKRWYKYIESKGVYFEGD